MEKRIIKLFCFQLQRQKSFWHRDTDDQAARHLRNRSALPGNILTGSQLNLISNNLLRQ